MVRTQIQLTEKQAQALREFAQEEAVSMAELVRRSIDFYIQQKYAPSAKERQQRLLSVVGIAHINVSDLAENHDAYLTDIYAEEEV